MIDYSKYTVLAIDDNVLNLYFIEVLLGYWQIGLIKAHDGMEGLRLANESKPDLILLDVNMPIMNGFEVCSRLKDNPELTHIPVLFLTTRVESEDVVEGFDVGASDYITKPFKESELKARIINQLRLLEYRRNLENAYNTISEDLEAASKIQNALLPHDQVWDNRFYCRSRVVPGVYVSGDTVNFFKPDKDHLCFYLADVSGHGASASFYAFSLNRLLAKIDDKNNPIWNQEGSIARPSEMLKNLNKIMKKEMDEDYYLTMIYGTIEVNSNRVILADAGNFPPVLLRNGNVVRIDVGGKPIGLFDDTDYDDFEMIMSAGESLLMYSDGLVDVHNKDMNAFSLERIVSSLDSGTSGNIDFDLLLSKASEWHGQKGFEDDIAIMQIRVLE